MYITIWGLSVWPGTKLLPTILPGRVAMIAVSLTGKIGVRQEEGHCIKGAGDHKGGKQASKGIFAGEGKEQKKNDSSAGLAGQAGRKASSVESAKMGGSTTCGSALLVL